MLTGESLPVEKGPNDEVVGATVNRTGSFTFRATRVGRETVLQQIVRMVEEAQGSRAPIARLADTVSGYFTPVVICVAFCDLRRVVHRRARGRASLGRARPRGLGAHHRLPLRARTRDADRDHGRHGARRRGRRADQAAARRLRRRTKFSAVVLDKTGTITEGRPGVTDVFASEASTKPNSCVSPRRSSARASTRSAKQSCGDAEERGLQLARVAEFQTRSRGKASRRTSKADASRSEIRS